MFLCFGHSLGWSEKTFCLDDVRILHSARMKICIFEPFPAYGKVGVTNQKIFSRHELLLNDQNSLKIVCFTSFKDQFNPRKRKNRWKCKLWSGELGNMRYCHCKNIIWPPGVEVIFPPKNFILKYFQSWCGFNYFWTKIYTFFFFFFFN